MTLRFYSGIAFCCWLLANAPAALADPVILEDCQLAAPGTTLRVSPGARVLAMDEQGRPLALLEMRADRRMWPLRVLRTAESP